MALRNIWNSSANQYQMSSLDSSVLELNNVPISGGSGGNQNLQQVLTLGSDANNQSITNLNNININGSMQINNSSSSTLQLNLGNNSYQLTNNQNEFSIQNFINNTLYKEVFRIDNEGNLLLGDSNSNTPYVYIFGSNGPSRIYDTLYNPVPSVSSNALSTINKSWALGSLNVSLAVQNPPYGYPIIPIYANFNPTINFPNCNHIKVNINSCIINTNGSGVISLVFLLISNKTNISTITSSDVAKNIITQPLNITISSSQINVSNVNCEIYDSSGINSLNLICVVNSPDTFYNLTSLNFSVSADTGLYSYLPSQTTY
jgi:hypothetical protein